MSKTWPQVLYQNEWERRGRGEGAAGLRVAAIPCNCLRWYCVFQRVTSLKDGKGLPTGRHYHLVSLGRAIVGLASRCVRIGWNVMVRTGFTFSLYRAACAFDMRIKGIEGWQHGDSPSTLHVQPPLFDCCILPPYLKMWDFYKLKWKFKFERSSVREGEYRANRVHTNVKFTCTLTRLFKPYNDCALKVNWHHQGLLWVCDLAHSCSMDLFVEAGKACQLAQRKAVIMCALYVQ